MTADPASPADPLVELVSRHESRLVALRVRRRRASGFLWRPGLVVTADEVLGDGEAVTVAGLGRAAEAAAVVGRDPSTDIALLRIEASEVEPLALSSDPPRAGAEILVLGMDHGTALVAKGVLSLVAGPWRSMRDGRIDARLELDVRLDPRAEGGLVLARDGRALGMAVAGPRGRTLTIPGATIERVAQSLLASGRIPRGYIGLAVQVVTVEGSEEQGLIALSVTPGGPAARAGILQGDVIDRWDDRPVREIPSLRRLLDEDSVGRSVKLRVLRAGVARDCILNIAEEPSRRDHR